MVYSLNVENYVLFLELVNLSLFFDGCVFLHDRVCEVGGNHRLSLGYLQRFSSVKQNIGTVAALVLACQLGSTDGCCDVVVDLVPALQQIFV